MSLLRRTLNLLGIYKIYEKWLYDNIKKGEIPSHIALILDGNRRWAIEKGYVPWEGHRFGAEKVDELLNWCLELGVKIVTLYVFSTENFKRPEKELSELFKLLEEKAQQYIKDSRIHKNRVKIKVIGRKNMLPEHLNDILQKLEEATMNYDNFFVNIAIAYGGRAEIVDATKNIAQKVLRGVLRLEDIDEKIIEKHLYTADLPKNEPDLIIRTSGEERISNFLLWQCAYSELVFLDVYWPEFRKIDLMRAIRIYQKRKRRFGA
ncbi:MAG: polyprenyl diphosphate synthase [Aigarchaeota archaeon]|nr:polyprenyl diphosphate synthase [Aigarchaeota archaeon]MDW7985921.1 polyprenyl diphosphate synthase [Nitrososphaerota archaeon]